MYGYIYLNRTVSRANQQQYLLFEIWLIETGKSFIIIVIQFRELKSVFEQKSAFHHGNY